MNDIKYATSEDGIYYLSCYPTYEAALKGGCEEFPELDEFYIGEIMQPEVEFIHEESTAESIIERIREGFYDEYYEDALDQFNVTDEQFQKLADRIKAAVDKWIEEEKIKAGFFVIRNPMKVRNPKFIK